VHVCVVCVLNACVCSVSSECGVSSECVQCVCLCACVSSECYCVHVCAVYLMSVFVCMSV